MPVFTMMNDQFSDKILERAKYDPLLKEIEDYNQRQDLNDEQFQQYLDKYIALLHLRDQGYPLLLRNGNPLLLDARPLTAHLLPPIPSKRDRWLLLTFLSGKFELQVQIIRWTIDDESAQVQPLADPVIVCTEEALASNNRFYAINFTEAPGHSLITLTFQEGVLNVTANNDIGIISTAWSKKITRGPVIERHSWGKMGEAIRIRRNPTGNWQDDTILDDQNLALGKGNFRYGWIRGADSPEDNPNLVYMATNQANVICIDKTKPDRPERIWSDLEDKALDALVVHVPGPGCQEHAIIASTDNGMVYLLLPGKQKNRNEKYVQLAGPRIERCIGFGSHHLLVLDSRKFLSPLVVTDPEQFWDIRDQATQKLIGHFYRDDIDADTDLSADQNRLLLEYSLLALSDGNTHVDQNVLDLFARRCDRLRQEMKSAIPHKNAEKMHEMAYLQLDLFGRLFKWLQRSTTHKNLTLASAEKARTLDNTWKLITPNPLAPDYLWLPLLRESGWLRRWAGKQRVLPANKAFANKAFANKLKEWEAKIQKVRKTFAAGLKSVRSLNTLNNYLLHSHCDHIEILDEEKGIIAVLEYTGTLLIFQIGGDRWDLLAHTGSASESSPQQPADGSTNPATLSFIHVLPELDGDRSTKEKIHLITGSSRGELRLIAFNRHSNSIELIHRLKCDAHLVCCLDMPSQKGVLLGGYEPDEKAVLYGWSYAKIKEKQPPKRFWKDDTSMTDRQRSKTLEDNSISSIRQLRLSKDGKRLWVMNKEKGRLYSWKIESELFANRRFSFPSPRPESTLRTIRNLNALDYSSDQNLLVCGGADGMAYAVDTRNGDCYWIVMYSRNLRRVVFLPDYPVPGEDHGGAWLLCGDDQSSLIVDRHGNVLGMIEQAGPICASAVFPQKHQVVLCTLAGRLLLMDYSSSEQVERLALPTMPDCYPVRSTAAPISNEQMRKMLAMDGYDSHCHMAVLYDFSKDLERYLVDDEIQNLFIEFWSKQPLERRILFLYWLRSRCLNHEAMGEQLTGFALKMIERAWKNFKSHSSVGLSCKLVSPLFDMLNRFGDNNANAQELLRHIKSAIWKDEPFGEASNPNNAIAAVRWNQSAKRWKEAMQGGDAVDIEVLFDWCNLMAKECNATTTKELQQSLSRLEALHLHNPPQDHRPSQWFLQFLRAEGQHGSADLPFKYLESPVAEPLSEQQYKELVGLFPNNETWIEWLQQLQEILGTLAARRQQKPHIAWQEQESWELLWEHISATGKHRFSVPRSQAMLALWWPLVVAQWESFIENKRQELDQSVGKKNKRLS